MEDEDGDNGPSPFVAQLRYSLGRKAQHYLDRLTPHIGLRWIFLFLFFCLYGWRILSIDGFHIVTYGLAIFVLNLFIGFLTPIDDVDGDGPLLPSGDGGEFKPFERRLPEFKCWLSCSKAVWLALFLTFIPFFNIPVFWPILVMYWIILFMATMKKQIRHMIKHRYLPWNASKKTYKKSGTRDFSNLVN
eukprot:gb/GEZN01017922.1/.p1 GENE.gb/GEZN01017922.1/~~gb/GEZN01017922.1/.p1  ORF type:complete len:189 (+),score=14.20 gb/GEZN01017922.1/:82-648(+)